MEIKAIPNQIVKYTLTPLELTKIDAIAFHHTASTQWNVKDAEKYHTSTNGWAAIGYNYFIEKDGTIYEGRGLNKAAAVSGYNSHIISVCLAGNFENEFPTDAQYNAAKVLTAYLKKTIPAIKKITLHKDWNETLCPGKNFNLERITAKELTTVNDIVWELSALGIITNKELWLEKLNKDINAYHLARKCLNKIRGIL